VGQDEVYEYLKRMRMRTDRWFTAQEIKQALSNNGSPGLGNIFGQCNQLVKYGLVEQAWTQDWRYHMRVYRKKEVSR
jgi:hypothetical protein